MKTEHFAIVICQIVKMLCFSCPARMRFCKKVKYNKKAGSYKEKQENLRLCMIRPTSLFFFSLTKSVRCKRTQVFDPIDRDRHNAAGSRLGEQDTHKGAGDTQLLCDLVLGHILLVIQAGNIYHSLDLLLWGDHKRASIFCLEKDNIDSNICQAQKIYYYNMVIILFLYHPPR